MFLSSVEIFEACKSSLIWVHTVCLYAYVKLTYSNADILLEFLGLCIAQGNTETTPRFQLLPMSKVDES